MSKDMEEKQIILRVDKELWKELRRLSVEKEISLNKLGIEALESILKKYKKKIDSN